MFIFSAQKHVHRILAREGYVKALGAVVAPLTHVQRRGHFRSSIELGAQRLLSDAAQPLPVISPHGENGQLSFKQIVDTVKSAVQHVWPS